jgi:alpha-mannosidase
MHDDSALVQARIDRFMRERLQPAIYRDAVPLVVETWEVPGEPVPFRDAVQHPFTPFVASSDWGKAWGTTWFHLTGVVPDSFAGATDAAVEVVVDLGFTAAVPGFQTEGTAYTPHGVIVKAIESLNRWIPSPLARGRRSTSTWRRPRTPI